MSTVIAWVPAIPVLLLMSAVVFLPGFAALRCLRLRWPVALAAGPAVTVAIAGLTAIAAEPLGLRWNGLTMVIGTIIVVGVAAVIGSALGAPPPSAGTTLSPRVLAGLIGAIVALPIAVFPFMAGIRQPDAPSQAWDAVFHLNVLRHILDTGHASSLTIGQVAAPEAGFAYYPGGWHDVISILSAFGVSLSANAGSWVIAGLVWTSGLALLAGAVFKNQSTMPFFVPVIGSCYAAFPARMLSYGTLWPNALATALLPSLFALLVLAMREGQSARARSRMLIAFVIALGGACLAHPTTLFAVAYLGMPLFIIAASRWVVAQWRGGKRTLAVTVSVVSPVVAGAALVGLTRVSLFGSVSSYPRPPTSTQAQAVGEALFDSMLGATGYGTPAASWLLGSLALVGAVLAFVRCEHRWVVASWIISVLLYVLAMGEDGPLRILVGFWYTDPVRLGGLVPLFAALLASWPLALAAEAAVARWAPRSWPALASTALAVLVVVALVLVGTWGFRLGARRGEFHRDYAYPLTSRTGLLSAAELDMLRRLPQTLPKDAVILGNPFNGSAYAMSIGDRNVVFTHLSGAWGADRSYLAKHFLDLATDPKVCRILDRLHVRYFYSDSRLYFQKDPKSRVFAALNITSAPPWLTEIATGGTATLYEITGCGS